MTATETKGGEFFLGLKSYHEPVEYRLGSAPMINTPGLLRWGINGYAFKKDRKRLLNVFTEGWPTVPADVLDRLLQGVVPYRVEPGDHGGTVVFTA